ncbi:MAG: YggT family protein [Clostridia bacterium]|nr:YggT family protein [Clostridia bacterium]
MLLVYRAISTLLTVLEWAIFLRVIISWLPIPRDNQFIRILYQFTEPILGPIRSIINRSSLGRGMMIDFSPIIAFLLIGVLQNVAGRILLSSGLIGL